MDLKNLLETLDNSHKIERTTITKMIKRVEERISLHKLANALKIAQYEQQQIDSPDIKIK